jgi:uncharacterized Zn finger protein (UPF0148 family)
LTIVDYWFIINCENPYFFVSRLKGSLFLKQITCEICGSNDLVKQDGMFICQYCQTKYSIEEAKKLMVEGTVKIDNSDKLENLYVLARRARDDNNSESASKYYDLILQEHPQSWEAAFYTVYYSAMQSSIANIPVEENKVSACAVTVLKLIKETVEDKAEQEKAVNEVFIRVNSITAMFVTASSNHYKNYGYVNNIGKQEYIDRIASCFYTLYNVADQLIPLFNGKYAAELAVPFWKTGISYHNVVIPLVVEKADNRKVIASYAQKIAKYEPDYKAPKSDGCYIATSVYGSYDCPEVWTLRRFRDFSLAKSWYGRLFILLYYSVSPTLVRLFGKSKWFRTTWRKFLNTMITNLQMKGFENTPYDDINWTHR